MELKDLKLTNSIIKKHYSHYKNRYCKILVDARYEKFNLGKPVVREFSNSIYNFFKEKGVNSLFVEYLRKSHTEVYIPEELSLHNDYYNSLMLAAQFEGSELCFGKMTRVGKDYVGCWVERKNMIFDMSAGVFFNKDETKDLFYEVFGVSKNNVVRISHNKLTESKESLDGVIKTISEVDDHKKKEYKLAYQAVKEGK